MVTVTLPPWLIADLETALPEVAQRKDSFARAHRVSGGCISPAARVETTAGNTLFVKWADDPERGAMFTEEARSLRALAGAKVIRVPLVMGVGAQWILLEWLPPDVGSVAAWQELGQDLADLHRVQNPRFGWPAANYIGFLPQNNEWSQSWPQFWRDRRLQPQLQRARTAGALNERDDREFHALYDDLEELLEVGQREGASLLHGDLWSGNVHPTPGAIALIDPSSYYGHREVDLAMAELFGGFRGSFYEAYSANWPLISDGREQRRAVYQLYYLLVHVNLFGSSYLDGTRATLAKARG
jgi:protein-ribulosamine 3-kinase